MGQDQGTDNSGAPQELPSTQDHAPETSTNESNAPDSTVPGLDLLSTPENKVENAPKEETPAGNDDLASALAFINGLKSGSQTSPSTKTVEKSKDTKDEPESDDVDEDPFKTIAENYDDGLAKAVKAIADRVEKKIRSEYEPIVKSHKAQQAAQAKADLDQAAKALYDGLDPAASNRYGKDFSSVDVDQAKFVAVQGVFQTALTLIQVAATQGKDLSIAEAVKHARALDLQVAGIQSQTQKANQVVRQRSAQRTVPPSGSVRNGSAPRMESGDPITDDILKDIRKIVG